MASDVERLFIPGWGARGTLYGPALPSGWTVVEPLDFRGSGGSFAVCARSLIRELEGRKGRFVLAGHSMGAALAIAAASRPGLVEGLVLISPAGLPLVKPMTRSLADFAGQTARGVYPRGEAAAAVRSALRAPRRAFSLARSVRGSDLSLEMAAVRDAEIDATVIGCVTDTLVSVAHCRQAASLLGARYRELQVDGGHMWMLGRRPLFAEMLRLGFA